MSTEARKVWDEHPEEIGAHAFARLDGGTAHDYYTISVSVTGVDPATSGCHPVCPDESFINKANTGGIHHKEHRGEGLNCVCNRTCHDSGGDKKSLPEEGADLHAFHVGSSKDNAVSLSSKACLITRNRGVSSTFES